ncbi:heterokaryon incompatibility [Ustulina deusta]|nr:heterokaryon incompatibility [Ustulina deusta]
MRLFKLGDGGNLEFTDDLVFLQNPKSRGSPIPPYAILSHTWLKKREEVTYRHITKRYFWIDTCCIDKRNSTEHFDEAINSMFRWYAQAERCYVYLSGTETTGCLLTSRWFFTRGWTLQELIYSNVVTRRIYVCSSLSRIAGIPIDVLQHGELAIADIEARISSVNHRETHKPEDMAYSLLGLCTRDRALKCLWIEIGLQLGGRLEIEPQHCNGINSTLNT